MTFDEVLDRVLEMLQRRDRDFCYHYGDSGNAVCQGCPDKQRAGQPSA